jgi:hypothetical protein
MTVTIQLTAAGADTGSFSIFSNLDLVTPIVTGISRASLLTGYAVVVPNGATSVIVKSNSTHCTNQVTIPITGITTTTTTTTQMCTSATYGYDPDIGQTACDNYISGPSGQSVYQWNGSILYNYSSTDPCGLTASIADPGYYSDGTNIWYWDGSGSFTYDSACSNLRNITIHAKRNGSIVSSDNHVRIVVSQDGGATWNVITPNSVLTASFTSTNQWTYSATAGNPLWIGALLSDAFTGISFGSALSPSNTTCLNLMAYCGNPSTVSVVAPGCTSFAGPFSYNYGIVSTDADIYLNFNTVYDEFLGNIYIRCY